MGQNYKNKKRLLIVSTTILSVVFCLALSLFLYQRAYANEIVHNVYFDGINLEGKTRAQAKTIIQAETDQLLGKKIVLKTAVGKTFEAPFSQTGVYIDSNQSVSDAFAVGRSDNFFKTLYALSKTAFKKNQFSAKLAFDDSNYKTYVTTTENNLNLPPVNASLAISAGSVVTNTSTNGVTVDASNLKDKIASGILSKDSTVAIEVPTTPITPTLLTESLSSAKTTAENYLTHQLNLTVNGQTYSIDKTTIAGWISFGLQNGKYSAWLNDGVINNYLAKIAATNDISVIDTKISASDNTTILQQGRQGVYIDQSDALNKTKAAISATTVTATIALVQTTKDSQIIKVFPNEGIVAGRFSGKYIDIDLTNQLLTLFDGTTQIAQYIVSSGKPSTPTPVGTRTVQYHDPRSWSSEAGLWMPWFLSMGGGYGIHELPEWPNGYKEGEAHLGTPVSHGCVRLGVGPAQTVYNWTPDGTQVFIHK